MSPFAAASTLLLGFAAGDPNLTGRGEDPPVAFEAHSPLEVATLGDFQLELDADGLSLHSAGHRLFRLEASAHPFTAQTRLIDRGTLRAVVYRSERGELVAGRGRHDDLEFHGSARITLRPALDQSPVIWLENEDRIGLSIGAYHFALLAPQGSKWVWARGGLSLVGGSRFVLAELHRAQKAELEARAALFASTTAEPWLEPGFWPSGVSFPRVGLNFSPISRPRPSR